MDEMIAYCGLDCSECPAYIATIKDDDEKRKDLAEKWSTEDFPLEPEDVNCRGCTEETDVMSFCGDCDVRECASERGVENCAHCSVYQCSKLDKIFKMDAGAKERLDEIHKSLD